MNRDVENFRLLLLLSAVTFIVGTLFGFSGMPLTDEQIPFMDGQGVGAFASPDTLQYLSVGWLVLYASAHVLAFEALFVRFRAATGHRAFLNLAAGGYR